MKILKLIVIANLIMFLPLFGITKENDNTMVNWLSFEEAFKLNEQAPRKIFIDIYADWCGYCKRMDAVTFSNPAIIKILNEQYYAVKFNAESLEPITFRGHEYVNENPKEKRSAHNFAIAILQGKMGYPSFAFFDESLNLITAIAGYRPPETFEPMLIFFVDDVFIDNPDLDNFIRNYESPNK